MAYDNERLVTLKQNYDRKAFLTDRLRELNKIRYDVRSGVLKLEHKMEEEQADVDKLQKHGITSFFYNLTGKYEEKYNKEYMEAREATDNYTKAAQELAVIDDELQRAEHEFRELGDAEKVYKEAFEEKVKLIIEANISDSERISSLDIEVKALRKEIKDMDAIMLSGRDVVSAAKHISLKLEEAYEYERRYRYNTDNYHYRARANECFEQANSYSSTLSSRLSSFKNMLIEISAFAKKYADISVFSSFLDWNNSGSNINSNTYPDSVVWQIEPVTKTFDIIYEGIEKKYAEVYGGFETMVLKIIL